jgi:nucleoside-diphosphate-sugar epimerase
MAAVNQVFDQFKPTNIIHLAALQLPFCKADPSVGAQVNVVGTVNIFEAAKRFGIRHVAYASSAAVYGMNEAFYTTLARYGLKLRSLRYKQANEGNAWVYYLDDGAVY